jgi:hypothetical protein
MKRNPLQEVRSACRTVAERAHWVAVDLERLPGYAASLPLEQALHPVIDPESHYLGHGADTVAFFLTLDTVNFGSGYFAELGLRPEQSGYFFVASALTERFRRHGPFSAARLCRVTGGDCLALLGQDARNPAAVELADLFAEALNGLGRFLTEQFDGSFTSLVEAAGGSAVRLVELLTVMPAFRDVADYHGLRVPFYKRAQLAAADLAIAFGGRGWGRFTDLGELTLFADNLVPHVLRHDGVLVCREELAGRIDAGEPIPAGSDEEIELRACAVHAVELLAAELARAGRPVTAMGLDQLLWNRGQQPAYRRRPRHRTKTLFY